MTAVLDSCSSAIARRGTGTARSGREHAPTLDVVGGDLTIPLVDGNQALYANLDHAASAPALTAVRDAVEAFLPWYASVHRGAGFASQVSTRAYERSRPVLREFVGGRPDDAVILTRNTTDATNLLAHCLPPDTHVVVFETEHHATLLPWRAHDVTRLIAPRSASDAVAKVAVALGSRPGPALVCVTGASNVTGEVWPVAEIAATARRYGARVLVDAAQLLPHRDIDIAALGVDYVAFSGHKLYAPYGAGALVGRADWLESAEPYLAGGGASAAVRPAAVDWKGLPERQEAGSPNVVGAYALAVACRTLRRGREEQHRREERLTAGLRAGLVGISGLRELSLFEGGAVDRVGTLSFVLDRWDSGLLAAALSAEYGIGVRDGLFCAHPLATRLLRRTGTDEATPASAVRVSLGLATATEHIDRLVRALRELATAGPRWHYARVDGRWQPDPDPRQFPPLL